MTLNLAAWPQPASCLSRLDPRWRLAGLLVALAAVTAVRSVPAVAAALAGAVLLAALARLPARWASRRLTEIGLALLPVVLLLPLTGNPTLALVIFLKGLAIATLGLVLLATAPLPATLAAAHALRVPGRLVHLTLLTYRYVFVLADELRRLRTALRVRGFRTRLNRHSYRTVGQVTGTLLVHGAARAERVAQAMRCRGFDGRFHTLAEFRTRTADVLAFALLASGALALVAGERWALLG
jgi:cobalt/nickel transport system permease protein